RRTSRSPWSPPGSLARYWSRRSTWSEPTSPSDVEPARTASVRQRSRPRTAPGWCAGPSVVDPEGDVVEGDSLPAVVAHHDVSGGCLDVGGCCLGPRKARRDDEQRRMGRAKPKRQREDHG